MMTQKGMSRFTHLVAGFALLFLAFAVLPTHAMAQNTKAEPNWLEVTRSADSYLEELGDFLRFSPDGKVLWIGDLNIGTHFDLVNLIQYDLQKGDFYEISTQDKIDNVARQSRESGFEQYKNQHRAAVFARPKGLLSDKGFSIVGVSNRGLLLCPEPLFKSLGVHFFSLSQKGPVSGKFIDWPEPRYREQVADDKSHFFNADRVELNGNCLLLINFGLLSNGNYETVKCIRVFDCESGAEIFSFDAPVFWRDYFSLNVGELSGKLAIDVPERKIALMYDQGFTVLSQGGQQSRKYQWPFEVPELGYSVQAFFANSGKWLIAQTKNGTLRAIDLATGSAVPREQFEMKEVTPSVWPHKITRGGSRILYGSAVYEIVEDRLQTIMVFGDIEDLRFATISENGDNLALLRGNRKGQRVGLVKLPGK
jgi:hypothetical protein